MASKEDWQGKVGQEWSRRAKALEALLGPPAEAGLSALGDVTGQRVLDLGCGAGGSTAVLAGMTGAAGSVLGVDVSPDLVEQAKARVAGLPNADVVEADAETHDFGAGAFDSLYSRFGSMFFTRPDAAFANLHRSLKPGAPAVFVAWASPRQNLWAAIPGAFETEGMERPKPQPGPGPFSWAKKDAFMPVLTDAGFDDVTAEEFAFNAVISEGEDPDPVTRATDFMLRIGPVAARLKGATDAQKAAARAYLTEALAPHVQDDAIRLASLAWVIKARA
ncbi:MAG: class I SAM-dependent methyltransferase [Pseudomonadota bacterium]